MTGLPHILLGAAEGAAYARPRAGFSNDFATPPRDRVSHAQALRHEFTQAMEAGAAEAVRQGLAEQVRGVQLTIESADEFELKLESLEHRGKGIELRQVWLNGSTQRAVVFVPRTAFSHFLQLIEQYETELTEKGRPKNSPLIDSIQRVRLAIVEDLWTDRREFPRVDAPMWWEVWLQRGPEDAKAAYLSLSEECQRLGLTTGRRWLPFAERVVTMVKARASDWGRSRVLLEMVAELRSPVEPILPYLDLSPREQGEWVRELAGRLQPALPTAPAVCLLDTGVNRAHPLLSDSLHPDHWQAVDPAWGSADSHDHHGTCMAGTALFGDLADVLREGATVRLSHRLESIRILPKEGANAPELYGAVFEQAISLAEIAAPRRIGRVFCLSVTAVDSSATGAPSSWSAAVDKSAFDNGDRTRLVVVSAGNLLRDYHDEAAPRQAYPAANLSSEGRVEDPGQSWNCLTIGAMTDRIAVSPDYQGWTPVAPSGGLTPSSRTSVAWDSGGRSPWPFKPDLVLEGGNWITDAQGKIAPSAETHLLTTALDGSGRLFGNNADTSAATAQAARMAAMIHAHYPSLRPETVRGLLVQSARWTDAMLEQVPGDDKASSLRRVRVFGFGVPHLGRAFNSLSNAVTLIAEGRIRPFDADGRLHQMALHNLPWPKESLRALGLTRVHMRVTLSYFIEPNPGRRGEISKSRYASHGLRFDVCRPGETRKSFEQRRSAAARDEDAGIPFESTEESREWTLGISGRGRGSLQSDWWTGSAEQLAESDWIAVFPVSGWWKERLHLGRAESPARYSLIVSIETPPGSIDLYAEVLAQSRVPVSAVVAT